MHVPPANVDIAIRQMAHTDLRFAAGLHLAALPHGLFPRLGERFLSAYLATFIDGRDAVAFVSTQHGRPTGFLVGVLDEPSHYRWVVRRRAPRLAAVGFAAILRRPGIAIHFARTRLLRYARGLVRLGRRSTAASSLRIEARPAVLSHLAVHAEDRRSGSGGGLVSGFLEAVRRSDGTRARLVTTPGRAGAGSFYERLGWRRGPAVDDGDGLTWVRYDIEV